MLLTTKKKRKKRFLRRHKVEKMADQIPWTTFEILEAAQGKLISGDIKHSFAGICIDSRKILTKDLFVAIKGNKYNGHDFIPDVIENKVRGLVVSKDKIKGLACADWRKRGIICVAVKDTTKALGDLASFNRKRSNASVIAITGSNGKTTTKEMTASILAGRFNTLWANGNFNNEIGLPLTLLKLNYRHKWVILELGMNKPGEISRLAEICGPDIGVITNIGQAHLKGVGSLAGVASAKGELLGKIKPGGTAVLNADDPKVLSLSEKTTKHILLYGLSKKAAIRAVSIKNKGEKISFTLLLPEESIGINLKVPGRFMVSNALAAASAGYLLGLRAGEIKDGLENFKPVYGRMNLVKTSTGVNIIDDTYNANPDSIKAAITVLKSLKGKARGILISGDMFELGNYADSMHKEIGSFAAESDIARLYATGEYAEKIVQGACMKGMNLKNIFTGTKKEIGKDLAKSLKPGDWVLVKGSRDMEMEKIVKELINNF